MAVTQGEVQQAQELARTEKARAEAIAARRHAAREIEAELGVQVLQEELLQLPGEIRRQQDAVRAAKQAVEDLRAQVEAAEANLMLAISAATTDAGKPAYSNDTARKAELARRKSTDPEYTQAVRALQDAEASLATAQADLDQLVNRFSAIRHLTDLQAARLRLLAG